MCLYVFMSEYIFLLLFILNCFKSEWACMCVCVYVCVFVSYKSMFVLLYVFKCFKCV